MAHKAFYVVRRVFLAIQQQLFGPFRIHDVNCDVVLLTRSARITYTARGTVKTHSHSSGSSRIQNPQRSQCSHVASDVRVISNHRPQHFMSTLPAIARKRVAVVARAQRGRVKYLITVNALPPWSLWTVITINGKKPIKHWLVCNPIQVKVKSARHHNSLSLTDQTSMSPDPSPVVSWAHTGQKPRDGTRLRL
jgi:hypothetical protein